MAKKLPIAGFVLFLSACVKDKHGYIFGARGEIPSKLSASSWYFTQYSGSQKTKALNWRANAPRIWDCQGLAEGYVNDQTGSNIDVRARDNYANWCSVKGTGKIPAKHRAPGAAVFIYSSGSGAITHVGYLEKPVDASKPTGDWYVIEARGVMYGVVRTKLSERGWNRWGLMDKYFDYSGAQSAPVGGDTESIDPDEDTMGHSDRNPYKQPTRILRKGDKGQDVAWAQYELSQSGYSLGSCGIDGDFGAVTLKAVKAFQKAARLVVDGEVGPKTIAALLADIGESTTSPGAEPTPEPTSIVIVDVSQHSALKNSKNDWAKIAKNVDLLILRCGVTRTATAPIGIGIDAEFAYAAKKCQEYGIPFGVYYYGKVKTAAEARKEADKAWETASPYSPLFYAYDVEESRLTNACIRAWADQIRKLGAAKVGMYIGHNYYAEHKETVDEFNFIWIPRYGKNTGKYNAKYKPAYPCDVHQYTSVGDGKALGFYDNTLDMNRLTGTKPLSWFLEG